MTMPIGSDEEPSVTMTMEQSIPVEVVSSGRGNSAAEFGYWRTFTFPVGATPVRIANRSLRRKRLLIKVNASLPIGVLTAPTTPAVPASTTIIQNPNPYPVTATLAGFTLTAVNVNGQQVGSTNGPYLIPAGGSISITYTVQGTWVWTNANAGTMQSATDGIFCAARDISNNVAGPASVPIALGTFQNGGYLQVNDNVRYEVQQELWVIPIPGNSATVFVTVSDEMFASDPMKTGRGRTTDDD